MFDFLFKTAKVEPDLSFLAVDMHSHLLPGLDDGLKEVEKSVEFIKELKKLGYQKLICTPHILSDLYPNNRETILPKLALVKQALADAGVNIKIDAAAEYMIDPEFADIVGKAKKEDFLTFPGDYILVEMSYLAPTPVFEQTIFNLTMLGLRPILAHPERYSYYHSNFERYERFKDLGCKLQVNLLSLSGGYGPGVKKTAEKLFKNEMVDFLGTDMHHERHLNMLKDLATKKEFYALVKDAELKNKELLS
ncbi:MAG: CpsB/CapC family capsule biosynthesis tyrosine phosphatase [Segetibacter sp.]